MSGPRKRSEVRRAAAADGTTGTLAELRRSRERGALAAWLVAAVGALLVAASLGCANLLGLHDFSDDGGIGEDGDPGDDAPAMNDAAPSPDGPLGSGDGGSSGSDAASGGEPGEVEAG
jgi:hypothetical protein